MAFKRSGVRLPLAPPSNILRNINYFRAIVAALSSRIAGEAQGKHGKIRKSVQSTPRSGRGGRRFKSGHSDHNSLSKSVHSLSARKYLRFTGTVMGTETPFTDSAPGACSPREIRVGASPPYRGTGQSMVLIVRQAGQQLNAKYIKRKAALSAATQTGVTKILRALHDFRSISLHPVDPDAVMGGLTAGDDYIKMSARLTEAFEKLEQIAQRAEKAIVFVNSRRMQSVLSRLIEQKFGCRKPEYIRGDTIAGQRQEIVNRFSALEGFAVLILSPRAAGVGLNIVAANHVIHLDRWWNPAVEDQCTDRAYRIGATKDVFVYTVGAVHPVLKESSYDVVLDTLLKTRRETSKRVFTSSEITAADFVESINSSNSDNKAEEILQEIDKSGYIFLEEFVRDRLLAEGLNANLTRHTGDGGADIVVRDELGLILYLVQCKHTTNVDTPIDAGLVDDARRVRENWRAKDAVVVGVSNAKRFSARVVDQFKRINGRLIARDDLWRLRFTG